MNMPMGRKSSIDFAIGGIAMGQTTNAIKTMLSNSDDDLLVVGYGFFNAATLDRLGIAEWLMAKPGRHVMLILGIHGKAPLWRLWRPWTKASDEFSRLLRIWVKKGVPLSQLHVYGVAHWHVKIAATLRRYTAFPKPNFSGQGSSDMEKMLTYDDTTFVTGSVTEAVIGSTNATYFAMDQEGNFELDVHIQRNLPPAPGHLMCDSRPELGQLNSKIHSLLKRVTAEVNNVATVSAKGTSVMRKELARVLAP